MTGTLQIKGGKYYCVLDYRDEKGARKRKWIKTGLEEKGNKRKATEMLNKFLMEYEQKEVQAKAIEKNENQCDILFTDYMKNWLEKKKNKVDIITWEGYSIYVNKHIIPFYKEKKLKLSELKSHHISEYYDYKNTSGRLDGKPGGLSPKSIKNHSLVIKEALDDALVNELVLRNVAAKIPIPKQIKQHKETFLNAEEANEVLKLFNGHKLQPLIYITLYYGLRRSEVLGLKWSAIDFKKDKIKINHTVVKHTSLVAKDKTKTEASRREYTLLPEIKKFY